MKNILLACGAGASSGFIAQKMRKAAQKQGLEVSIPCGKRHGSHGEHRRGGCTAHWSASKA